MNIKLLFVGLMVIFSLFGTISAQCGYCTYPDAGGQCWLQRDNREGSPTLGLRCGCTKSFAYFVYQFTNNNITILAI